MDKKRLCQCSSLLLTVLLLMLFFVSLAGCAGQVSGQVEGENSKPFYNEGVATVRIVMSEKDWEITQKNPGAEEYVKADFWFDDELVPDVAVRPKGNSSLMSVDLPDTRSGKGYWCRQAALSRLTWARVSSP